MKAVTMKSLVMFLMMISMTLMIPLLMMMNWLDRSSLFKCSLCFQFYHLC